MQYFEVSAWIVFFFYVGCRYQSVVAVTLVVSEALSFQVTMFTLRSAFVISEGGHWFPESLSARGADGGAARPGLPARVPHREHLRASPPHQAIQSCRL
jgi:hypothetical protein